MAGTKTRARPDLLDTKVERPSTEVTARPVDAFARPFENESTTKVFNALNSILTSGGKLAVMGAEEAQRQGVREWDPGSDGITVTEGMAEQTGEPRPVSRDNPKHLLGRIFTSAYKSGFDAVSGEKKSFEYFNEAYQITERLKSQGATREALDAELEGLRQKYLGSMVSDVETDAFLPRASTVEEKLTSEFVMDGVKKAHEAFRESARSNLRNETTTGLQEILSDIAYTDSEGVVRRLEVAALSTTEGLEAFVKNADLLEPRIAEMTRKLHRDFVLKNGGNLTKPEATDDWTTVLASMASDLQVPELLSGAFITSGRPGEMAIVDLNGVSGPKTGEITRTFSNAMNARREQLRYIKQERRQEVRDNFSTFSTNMITELTQNPNRTPEEAAKALQDAEQGLSLAIEAANRRSPGALTREDVATAYTVLYSMKESGMHPKTTLDSDMVAFYKEVSMGRITVDWVEKRANRYDYPTWVKYIGIAAQEQDARTNRRSSARDRNVFTENIQAQLFMRSFPDLYNPKKRFTPGPMDPNGARRQREAEDLFWRLGMAKEEETGHRITGDEMREIMKQVKSDIPVYIKLSDADVEKIKRELMEKNDWLPPNATPEQYMAWEAKEGRTPTQIEAMDRSLNIPTQSTLHKWYLQNPNR